MEETFTRAIDILYLAKQNEVDITLNGDQLQLKIAKGKTIDKNLLEKLSANKKLIIDFLSNDSWKTIANNTYEIANFDRDVIKHIPLSFSQERLWFIDKLEGSVQYHLPAVMRLKGKLDREVLENTLQTVLSRHEVLRTVILEDEEGQGYQHIMPGGNKTLIFEENSKYLKDKAGLDQHIEQLINTPFDLSKDHMLRANLIKISDDQHVLVVTMHHIASDGWSISVLVKEVIELYASYIEKRPAKLPVLKIQYADYSVWQRDYLQGEVLENKIGYWKSKLDNVATLQLPTDYSRPPVQSSEGATQSIKIDQALSARLVGLGHQCGATLYMTLLSAFKVLLHRYSGQEDICVGTPIAGRNHQELENLIGFFVNTLALRSNVTGEMTFVELLQEVKKTTLDAYGHQEIPFEKIVEVVVKERDMSRNPLFQVLFSLQNIPEVPEMKLGELNLIKETQERTTAKFDIAFLISETSSGIQGTVEYSTDLYKDETIERMIGHYLNLLSSIVTSPHEQAGRLGILSAAEEGQLLVGFNDTAESFPQDESIISLFEAQAARSPGATAVVFEDHELNYRQLNEQSNQLANYLQKQGVKTGTLVPIIIERGLEMIIGILGILKAGGTYVPIDPEYPQDRINYMLGDMGAELVLSSRLCRSKASESEALKIVEIDGDRELIGLGPKTNRGIKISPEQLAYVIYTSGSTGKPKGVMMPGGNLVNLLNWQEKQFENKSRRVLQFATFTFDVSFQEIFSTLCFGSTLYLINGERRRDVDELLKDVDKYRITHLFIPFIVLQNLAEAFALLSNNTFPEEVIVAGEQLKITEAIEKLLENSGTRLINQYGPTEAHVVTSYIIDNSLTSPLPPIGKPISNTQIYILNRQKELSPLGVPGEIYIGGVQVAKGYLNRAELTSEKFTADPFSADENAKLYRTGDLGRWLPDANIEYMGRMDDQVKIRGYRIELGEIESVLMQSEQVRQAVVLAKNDIHGTKRLTAYVVPEGAYDKSGIISFLQSRLPEYMVPALWVEMENLPVTINGKIDKRALPDAVITDIAGNTYTAPRNETEAALAEIWQRLLGVTQAGIYDNFFELGGHSLLAMRVVSAIRRELNVEISIRDLFTHPTVAGLGAELDKQSTGTTLPAITAGNRPGHIPLSFSQERLWFIDQLEGSVQYHLPAVLRLKGELKQDFLEKTLNAVINRHEVLRTVILEDENGQGYQYIKSADKWSLGILTEKDKEALPEHIQTLINKPFDLSSDYMLRADLIKLEDQEHILVVTMHHIASDGWSVPILVKEVAELYESYVAGKDAKLAALPVQYADYALWQRRYLHGEVLENKLSYWKEKLNGVATLQLPSDHSRPPVQSSRGAAFGFKIEEALSKQLLALGRGQGATLYMTLLAAFKVMLYRYSGQQDICVGTPVAGRGRYEVEGLIGFFINTLALRDTIAGDMTFTKLLEEVKNTTLDAYANQEVPFEKVVDAVVKERDLDRNPLFQVLFSLQNTPDVPEMKLWELSLTAEKQEYTKAKFDIAFIIRETGTGIRGTVEYSTDLYEEGTIARMTGHYINLLNSVVISPQGQAGRLSMLSGAEKEQLLTKFNDTKADYPKDKSITALFEEQVTKTPNAAAVIFEGKALSYKELNERSNQLAHYLKKHGVKSETLVPVCIERSAEMIVGILGILKAGGAYVPIDPEYPQDRISFMLEDTRADLVLSSTAGKLQLKGATKANFIEIDRDWKQISNEAKHNTDIKISANHLAYVIYTSGSTGRPKGVMVEQHNVVSLVKSVHYVALGATDSLLVTGSPSFDATTFEYWGMLLNGGRLIIYQEDKLLDSVLLRSAINSYQVNIMWFTSSWFNQLVDSSPEVFAGLKTILVGGEKLSEQHIEKIRNIYPDLKLINGYGPTENTTFSLTYPINDKELRNSIPIGRPLNNRNAYILTSEMSLSPIGIMGELYIGGAGLARGYLNRPDLTAERFIKDPFSEEENARLYRTGDLGRWLVDGNIEYQGRMDDQVKIRGYRIELGEIESVLTGSGLIKQGVILARTDNRGTKRLVGYVVPEGTFDKQAIQEYLGAKLPEYMVPQQWVALENLPLTANGKTDRKALPEPEMAGLTAGYTAPRNEAEAKLAETWQELLGLERVGIYDNFFELGGDSILTIQVVSRMRRLGYVLQPRDLFNNQDIAGLSAKLGLEGEGMVTGEQGGLSGTFGLLPVQSWYLGKETGDASHFNQAVLLKIDKRVTAQALQAALDTLRGHHDALRLEYKQEAGQWEQSYGAKGLKLSEEDLRGTKENKLAEIITARCNHYQQSLSIGQGELMRMVWIQTPEEEEKNRLFMVIHHLLVDGVSWRMLIEDLEQQLDGQMNGEEVPLGAKGSSYRQWRQALTAYSESKKLQSQAGYWANAVNSYKPLPKDKIYSGKLQMKDMADYQVKLGADKTRQLLQEVPKVYHTEINDLLLGALSTALCNWSGDSQAVIGLEGHGREAVAPGMDISGTVGWFTSLYPMVLKASAEKGGQVKETKEALRAVPDKGLGYGVLKYISKIKELQGNDPWDIMFNYLGQLDTAVGSGSWLSAAGEPGGANSGEEQAPLCGLSVNSQVSGGRLVLNWGYSTRHYQRETIEKLAGAYIEALTGLISHCLEQNKTGVVYTPSDYGLNGEVSYQELDSFLGQTYKDKKIKDQLESLYRLSGLQQGMLFHGLYDSSGSYTEQFACDLVDVKTELLAASWAEVIGRHSILRSAFYYDAFSVPVQCVYREVQLPIEQLDYRSLDEKEREAAVKALEAADRAKGFDFKAPPLMRLSLVRLTEDRYRMLWTAHHILFDGWSLPILIEGFLTAYGQLLSGNEVSKTEEDKYEDYIRYLERQDKEAAEHYWRNYLKDIEQGTLLPFIRTTAERTKGKGTYGTEQLRLNAAAAARVQHYAQAQRLTVNTLMQGIWALLLHKYTGVREVTYGVIVSGRPEELQGVEQRVGMYINTLPLKAEIDESEETASWLQQLQAGQVSSRQYQYTPLQEIQGWTGIKGDLFDSLLIFENYPVSKLVSSGEWSLKVENIEISEQTNYPLTIVVGSSEQLSISFNYNTALLEQAYATAIRDQFEQVLLQVTEGAAATLKDIRLLTEAQEQQLLTTFNDTKADYPKDKSIIDLFEAQAQKTPDATAVIFEDEELSYKELNERANQLASYLTKKGIKAETLVPVCIERSPNMVTGILGILKAGGAYVPVDPEYPGDRISYMLEDTNAGIILSSKASKEKLSGTTKAEVIAIDEDWQQIEKEEKDNPDTELSPKQLAYVIYTSGSTGKPKGVLIEHGGLATSTLSRNLYYRPVKAEFLIPSYSFDSSVAVIFGTLTTGGNLILCKDELIKDIDNVRNLLSLSEGILCVPSYYKFLLEEKLLSGSHISRVILAGEKLDNTLVDFHYNETVNVSLFNEYGPTEGTVWATVSQIKPEAEKITIGRPISNTQIYILNKDNGLSPMGVTGDICIGGDGLARGYLHRPGLTAEKFIKDPFSQDKDARLYKTGDLGRWLPEGNIEYQGRADDQVKIRGYRIELGEIEGVLMQSGQVKQAVVLAKEDKEGTKRLVGYVIPEGAYDKAGITAYLQSRLPDYMVPGLWVALESFPLTPNGKTDKKALPDPGITDISAPHTAPRNETEIALADIWQELLNVERAGIDANFFELGGHSLLAMRVVSAIRKELDAEISIRDLFAHPTIAGLGAQLGKQGKGTFLPAITAAARPERIPLSYSQERLWFIDKLEGSVQYHLPAVLRLKGTLKPDILEKTLRAIISRHEVLRTVIKEDEEGQGYQQAMPADGWKLGITAGITEKEQPGYIQRQIARPFKLSSDYMLRAELIKQHQDGHILVVTMHHIASDGWSVAVLVKEVAELYESYAQDKEAKLPGLPVQYADYAIWQRQYLRGEALNEKIAYWKAKLENTAPLELATDYGRPAVQSTKGAAYSFNIGKTTAKQLQALSHGQGATLYMTLLTAFKVLLYRYSGQEDICVGTPVAGRNNQEVEGLIGFFINTLALRDRVTGDMPFTKLLEAVKSTTLDAYAHQEAPFEKVVDAVVKERDRGRNPIFQVLFSLQNTPEVPEIKLGELGLTIENPGQTTTQFDLSFTLAETGTGIQGTVEYSTELYQSETIVRMAGHYINLLRAIIAAPQEAAVKLGMLSEAEEQQLLATFNDTKASYPKDKSITALFEQQAQKTPDATAVVFEDEELSYKELNERSNQLAHYLQKQGITAETLIPICIERSVEMIIGILGILKAGGAYVPIDPDYPQDRISYMLEDTNAGIIITSEASKEKLKGITKAQVISIDEDRELIEKEKKDNPNTKLSSKQLAYVIYTSGSTGRPKGVLIQHDNVVRLFKTEPHLYDFNEQDVWTMFHSFCFDFSVWEMYGALFYGGKLIIVPKEVTRDILLFSELLLKEKVTVLNQTPSAFYNLQDVFSEKAITNIPTRYVIFGGEALNSGKLQFWKQAYPGCRMINMYGITETTVHVTYREIEWQHILNGSSIIGKPIPTLSVYILTSEMSLSPIGIMGELYIGGAGLARGYLNRPDLTAERFIKDPFSEEENARLYRTGDLGRWLVDGNIEYQGRMDDQVKIRGYRIELGEIESVLTGSGLIKQGVILARTDNRGTKRLVGYVVPEGTFDKQAIQEYLGAKLPEYMVPQQWVALENLPLTANGKTDRKALPEPEMAGLTAGYTAPRNEAEAKLAETWQELLGLERVGIYDNFFELGGDSILTIQVVSRMRRLGYVLQPRDLFNNQDIAGLSAKLGLEGEGMVTGEQGGLSGTFGLLPVQSWYLGKETGDASHFNQAVLLKIDKRVTAQALQAALDRLRGHHDALRLEYKQEAGQWEQSYGAKGLKLSEEDLRGTKENKLAEIITARCNHYQQSLSIGQGELMRMVWIQTPEEEEKNRLFMVIHHLLVDGVSWRMLIEDLEQQLDGQMNGEEVPLGAKGSSYRQWRQALTAYSESKKLQSQASYWANAVNSYKPLPKDKIYSGKLQMKDMADYQVKLGADKTRQLLQEVPKVYHTEINDLLLGALSTALCNWSGDSQAVIGLEGHGREAVAPGMDISGTVGWFTSLYPMVLKASAEKGGQVKETKEALRAVPDKGLGYGVLKYISKIKELQGNDPWDIMFNYLGQLDTAVGSGSWLSAAGEPGGANSGQEQAPLCGLSVNSQVSGGRLVLNWGYSTRHYQRETIEKLAGAYIEALTGLIGHCLEQNKTGVVYTPSDYGLNGEVSYQELDSFLEGPYLDDDIMSF